MVQIRKIESSEESERKRKRNTLILSIFMIGILVFSTAGYFTFSDDSDEETNSAVQNVGDAWILTYGGQTMRVSSSIEEAKNTSILSFKTIEYYSQRTVYVASDSDAGFYEVASTLGRYTGRMQEACYGKCNENLPEKDCNETMIVIKMNAERGKIYETDNCVFIEGDISAIDALIYKVFGVI